MENYKKLLLGLCKYHQNLIEKSNDILLKTQEETCVKKKTYKEIDARTLKNQASAVFFFLNEFKSDVEEYFGSFDIKSIATHPFYEEDRLSYLDKIPVEFIGVKKNKSRWRLNGLKYIIKDE